VADYCRNRGGDWFGVVHMTHGGKRIGAGRKPPQIDMRRVLVRLAQGNTITEIAAAFGVDRWIVAHSVKRHEFKIKIANDMKTSNMESGVPGISASLSRPETGKFRESLATAAPLTGAPPTAASQPQGSPMACTIKEKV
jgi:hypothetical protein